jgi:5-methylcytosine-specific restriction enzyme A
MPAIWMTWSPNGWPIERLRELAARFDRDGSLDTTWRVQAHRKAGVGDQFFLFKQGLRGPRGIFGFGTITSEASLRPDLSPNPEKPQHYVMVHFTNLVDPTIRLLVPLNDLVDVAVPKKLIDAQASGLPIAPDVAANIADLLGLPSQGDDVKDNPTNPPWNRDELIIVLDAYIRWIGKPPAKASHDIEELSQTISDLRRILGTGGQVTLRNVNGVYMKLMNFRRFDPAFASRGKSGLIHGNRLEEEVWNEFHGDAAKLAHVADAIRKSLKSLIALGATVADGGEFDLSDEEEAIEGKLLTVQHHRRERSHNIVKAKKASALKANGGALICEVCDFEFRNRYGGRGEAFIECHHVKPVATLGDGTPTRQSDLALVCANCHRMIHTRRPWLTVEQLRLCLVAAAT